MPDIITDFSDIAKRANLKALEGRPQDDVTAGIPRTEPAEPAQDYSFMYWAAPDGLHAIGTDYGVEGMVTLARSNLKALTVKTVWSIAENCMVPVWPDGGEG